MDNGEFIQCLKWLIDIMEQHDIEDYDYKMANQIWHFMRARRREEYEQTQQGL